MPTKAKTQDKQNDSDELEKYTGFTTAELKGLQSFEDVEKLFAERGETVDSAAEELGDGFALLATDRKDILIDTPLMVVSWIFSKGDYGDEFVAARVLCRMENSTLGKYVVTDGSTGICAQLRQYTDDHEGKQGGLFVAKGLRRSDYTIEDPDTGKPKNASTYYLSTSA